MQKSVPPCACKTGPVESMNNETGSIAPTTVNSVLGKKRSNADPAL